MKLTAKSRYAISTLLDLALHTHDEPILILALANRHKISLSYLTRLFAMMRQAGLVQEALSHKGGYALGRSAHDITIAAVIESVKNNKKQSTDHNVSLSSYLWADLDSIIASYLSHITLADIIASVQQDKLYHRQIDLSVLLTD